MWSRLPIRCVLHLLTGSRCPTAARPPSYNVAPSQLLYVIRENHETGERTLELLRWGLIPHGCKDPEGGRKPINARAKSVARLPTFRAAYAKRRCIVPVDCFFEWRAVKGARAKQPFAVAMEDRTPFAIGGVWENWRDPQSGEWIRTVAIITVPSNELVAQIHHRMPLILPKQAYERWLGGGRPPRSARAVPGGTHGHVAGLDAR